LTREEKEKEVAWLREQFQGIKGLFLTDYQGLTVAEMNDLRTRLRAVGITYKVVKNTLARRALEETPVAPVEEYVVGPRGAAWTDEDDKIPPMAKVLVEFAKDHPKLNLVRGVVGGTVVDSNQMESLSKLPSREELLARLVGNLAAPVGALVRILAQLPRSVVTVLKAIEEQKKTASDSAAG
jgi:large subunit ribosomal protein L10